MMSPEGGLQLAEQQASTLADRKNVQDNNFLGESAPSVARSASHPDRVEILTRQVLEHWSGGKEGARLPIPLDLSRVKTALPTESSVVETIQTRFRGLLNTPGWEEAKQSEGVEWALRSITQCPVTGQWYCKLPLSPADIPSSWTWFIAVVHPKRVTAHEDTTPSLTLCHDFRPSRSQREQPAPWQHRYMFNLKAIALSEAAAVADGTIRGIVQVPSRRKVNFASVPGELQLVPMRHPSRAERWRVLLPFWPEGPPLLNTAPPPPPPQLCSAALSSSAVFRGETSAGAMPGAARKRPRLDDFTGAPFQDPVSVQAPALPGGSDIPSPWEMEEAGAGHARAPQHRALHPTDTAPLMQSAPLRSPLTSAGLITAGPGQVSAVPAARPTAWQADTQTTGGSSLVHSRVQFPPEPLYAATAHATGVFAEPGAYAERNWGQREQAKWHALQQSSAASAWYGTLPVSLHPAGQLHLGPSAGSSLSPGAPQMTGSASQPQITVHRQLQPAQRNVPRVPPSSAQLSHVRHGGPGGQQLPAMSGTALGQRNRGRDQHSNPNGPCTPGFIQTEAPQHVRTMHLAPGGLSSAQSARAAQLFQGALV